MQVFRAVIVSASLALIAGCGESKPRVASDSARVPLATPDSIAAPVVVTTDSGTKTPAARAKPAARVARAAPRHIEVEGVDFTGVGYDRGNPDAPVVVVDLSDFACPYCGEFARETFPAIDRDYVRTGKVYFKYVPFVAGSFPHSREATRAAECAGEQGKFWEMFERIYATSDEWRKGDADARMAALARATLPDSAGFAACYADGRTAQRTARATDVANSIGVRITPSFLVNGRPVQGALPLAEFRHVIDAALLVAGQHHGGT